MIRLGIVGSDNSHGSAVAHVCNILRKVPMRVTHLWGETPKSARTAAEKGAISNIVSDWRKLAANVDGVMVNHRHGRDHFAPAAFFLRKNVPVFVDKPIFDTLTGAKKLFALADEKRVPLATFGVLPLQKGFKEFRRNLRSAGEILSVSTTGPADIHSPYGGVFYYGFHQADIIAELLGPSARSVNFLQSGENGVATIRFDGGRIASMHCLKSGGFHWMAAGSLRSVSAAHHYDEIPYLAYTRKLHRLVSAGELPLSVPRMLAPIAILEALQKAVETGKEQKVKQYS